MSLLLSSSPAKWFKCLAVILTLWSVVSYQAGKAQEPGEGETRALLVEAILAEDDDQQIVLIQKLADTGDSLLETVFEQWKRGEVFVHTTEGGEKIPFTLENPESEAPSAAIKIIDAEPLTGADGGALSFVAKDLTAVDTSRSLRKEMKNAVDFLALSAKDPKVRAQAAKKLGLTQNASYIPVLERRLSVEKNKGVKENLREGLAVTYLAVGTKDQVIEATRTLAKVNSLAGLGFLKDVIRLQEEAPEDQRDEEILAAAKKAELSIENHFKVSEFFSTAFRGLSSGSVLLVVALGLAITFGLMGVINMAHGEMIAIGAYATYQTQVLFVHWFGDSGLGFQLYFIAAIPIAFLSAAIVGAILERGIIQFLYKRPLESLLATWGVSLVLQQSFRLIFGASNRQVNSPGWLMGNFDVNDVNMGFNRLFIIGFAIVIVFGTWVLMTKTPLGLCIRSVMQNPHMAACMGIRTAKVRMMTFAFGSGLAGLAGAFLSQIGNVGADMGQNYIVDSFMVVVAGGTGSLVGTVTSAFSIGVVDQVLQPFLGPVMGKIFVLFAIILFLQWRPEGLFPTKSRSLD